MMDGVTDDPIYGSRGPYVYPITETEVREILAACNEWGGKRRIARIIRRILSETQFPTTETTPT